MKRFFFAVLALVALTAQAATITLEDSGDCPNMVCSPVANDAGDAITLSASANAGRVSVIVNSKAYDSGLHGAVVDYNGFGPTICYATDGTWVTVSAAFAYTVVRTRGVGHPHWALTSGSIIAP